MAAAAALGLSGCQQNLAPAREASSALNDWLAIGIALVVATATVACIWKSYGNAKNSPAGRGMTRWAVIGMAANMCGTASATGQGKKDCGQPLTSIIRQTTLPVRDPMRSGPSLDPRPHIPTSTGTTSGDNEPKAKNQERKRPSEEASGAGKADASEQWLDAMLSARATVTHVEPYDEKDFHSI